MTQAKICVVACKCGPETPLLCEHRHYYILGGRDGKNVHEKPMFHFFYAYVLV